MSLFWRIFLLNAAVLTVATTLVLAGPVTVSTPVLLTEAVVLSAGLAAMLAANAVLLRVGLALSAQEALTNAARHSGARTIEVCLRRYPGEVRLRISDDGRGFGRAPQGAGIRGMRERALLIGAALSLGRATGGGADVRLRVRCDAGGC